MRCEAHITLVYSDEAWSTYYFRRKDDVLGSIYIGVMVEWSVYLSSVCVPLIGAQIVYYMIDDATWYVKWITYAQLIKWM